MIRDAPKLKEFYMHVLTIEFFFFFIIENISWNRGISNKPDYSKYFS